MWTWAQIIAGLVKLANSVMSFFTTRKIFNEGVTKGRLETQAEQAAESKAADAEQSEIANKPPDKAELIRRLKDGSA